MNDTIADQTIEDHKYLLEIVENRCAIAFYAATNRNQSLYNALQRYYQRIIEGTADVKKKAATGLNDTYLENIFIKMIQHYDFMSLVMYPELKNRREFIHDVWIIAKATENDEFKIAVSLDEFFYITSEDILNLLRTRDDKMITHLVKSKVNLYL